MVSVSMTFVTIVTSQVTVLPPDRSEPLHWSTVTGKAALVVPDAVHAMKPPPPSPDPLHWVTVADPEELGMQAVMSVPPPPPDPMHWLTVIADAGAGALALMLVVMCTEQTMLLPPYSLSDPLHWCTALITSVELVLSPVHSLRVQTRR